MVVKLFQQLVTESTDWVPATQPFLYSALLKPIIESPYLVHSTVLSPLSRVIHYGEVMGDTRS